MKTILINVSKWEDYLFRRREHIAGELGQGLYSVSPGVRAYLRGQEELLGELLSILRLIPTEAIEEEA